MDGALSHLGDFAYAALLLKGFLLSFLTGRLLFNLQILTKITSPPRGLL